MKKRKFDKIMATAEDAELIDKSQLPLPTEQIEPPKDKEGPIAPSPEEIKRTQFDTAVTNCLNIHKEKGGMAFDLLKAAISNKLDTIINGKNFSELVKACYVLADTFKLEMDTRWTQAVNDISQQVYGPVESSENTQSVESPEETAPTNAPETTVAAPETIN